MSGHQQTGQQDDVISPSQAMTTQSGEKQDHQDVQQNVAQVKSVRVQAAKPNIESEKRQKWTMVKGHTLTADKTTINRMQITRNKKSIHGVGVIANRGEEGRGYVDDHGSSLLRLLFG